MGLLSVVGSYSRRSARGRQFGTVRMRWWGKEWWARPTLRKTVYMLYQDRGSRRPTHGDAVGYSDAAPYGAGRVFTNADLLTPEGSHIIAHGCAVGPLGVANISMSSRVGAQDFEPLRRSCGPTFVSPWLRRGSSGWFPIFPPEVEMTLGVRIRWV